MSFPTEVQKVQAVSHQQQPVECGAEYICILWYRQIVNVNGGGMMAPMAVYFSVYHANPWMCIARSPMDGQCGLCSLSFAHCDTF